MAVNREFNWSGQQRIDIPHLRMVESGVRYDFDALSYMLVGQSPQIVEGFTSAQFTGYTGEANAITFTVAGAKILHPLATESGGVFALPTSLPDDVIDPALNPNVTGAWIPNAKNYLGVDFRKEKDATTTDTVKFLNSSKNTEISDRVPLARTISHKWIISTLDFSYNRNICPVAVVNTTAQNKVTVMYDVRPLLCRLTPGSVQSALYSDAYPYGWPGGRPDLQVIGTQGGDKSIKSLKEWMNAVMTRLWELGGGSYWFSLTADRNVQMSHGGSTFTSTGESFEIVSDVEIGLYDIHWKGISFVFDNSTECICTVNDQITNLHGLTNLAEDGDCIYVDIDRRSSSPVTAQKGNLKTLGGSSRPGHRFVMAWRLGDFSYVRGQSYPIGYSLKLATTTIFGTLKSSLDLGSIAPIAATIVNESQAYYTATCGGLSHNEDIGSVRLIAPGDLYIGRGESAGDHNVRVTVNNQRQIFLKGNANNVAIVDIEHVGQQATPELYSKGIPFNIRAKRPNGTAAANGQPVLTTQSVASFSSDCSWALAPITILPEVPTFQGVKYFVKSTKTWKVPVKLAELGYGVWDYDSGTQTVITNSSYGSGEFGPLTIDGVAAAVNNRVLLFSPSPFVGAGIYRVTVLGDGISVRPQMQRTYDADNLWTSGNDFFDGIAVRITHGSTYAGKAYAFNCNNKIDAVDIENDPVLFEETNGMTADQMCLMWFDGSYTVIATSPLYEVA